MRKSAEIFLNLLQELQRIDVEFPLQYAVCFFEISLMEGMSISLLARKTGMPLSTVSRIVGALSNKRQCGKPFALIEVKISNIGRRRKQLFITPEGRALIQSIQSILTEAA